MRAKSRVKKASTELINICNIVSAKEAFWQLRRGNGPWDARAARLRRIFEFDQPANIEAIDQIDSIWDVLNLRGRG